MLYRHLPRRRRCVSIFIVLCLVNILFFIIYSLYHRPQQTLSDLRTSLQSRIDDPDILLKELEKSLPQLTLADDYTKYWKYFTGLHDYKVDLNAEEYRKVRSERHFFDPRVTLAVYAHHIRKQLAEGAYGSGVDSVHVPFSWQDWVDLSDLNVYLRFKEDDKPSCRDFLEFGVHYSPLIKGMHTKDKTKIDFDDAFFNRQPCTDDADYEGPTDEKLLPGFNFQGRCFASWYLEKKIQAKSIVLSSLPLPSSLVFLSKNGIYETGLSQDETMLDSGLFDEFVEDTTDSKTGSLLVDPISEYKELQKVADVTEKGLDFDSLLSRSTNYQYEIPMDEFYYDYNGIIDNLTAKEDSLTTKESRHLQNLKYSRSLNPDHLSKSFREVELTWSQSFHGHKITENGAHYDSRFFGGFLTESKVNEFDNVDVKRKLILHRMLHTWLQFTYKTGIVSILAHGSLLSWWWNGLVFEWDSDIDVQMPIMELDRLCAAYNGSLVFEDAQFGFHKYFVDCTNSITHRDKGNGNNNIDARFIDVDSGMYVDITGLAFTGTHRIPKRIRLLWQNDPSKFQDPHYKYQQSITDKELEKENLSLDKRAVQMLQKRGKAIGENEGDFHRNCMLHAFNCRNNHFYTYEEFSPLRLSSMEGSPVLIPNQFEDVLLSEYKRGMTRKSFNKNIYVSDLRLWMPMDTIKGRLGRETKKFLEHKLVDFLSNNRLKSLEELLGDDDIMKEFYLTYKQTRAHVNEVELVGKMKSHEITGEEWDQFHSLMEKYKEYTKPMRKDYYNYMAEVMALEDHQPVRLKNLVDEESYDEVGFFLPVLYSI
ncbi:hypothetical protein FOA43_000804 [Brettanomyces nanus]|uniref:LicD/FKTN/FKRP nucleotidyltransferase domain-containing protein n=1 Tax=Eeniella nana TaxID=13502 RepID=A0A875RY37_EENNA|nr:uncharacterized protein FOA43_000804 [Brettanomyces nanus]QPG73493.1 hypothetical protein FOA43_000804 [Brettanomyces nanus]